MEDAVHKPNNKRRFVRMIYVSCPTYHVTFCIYCLGWYGQPVALHNETVFFLGGSGCGCDPPCFLFSRRTGEGRVWCYCESCCLEERFRISEVDDNENPASPPLHCSMNSCLSRYWNLFCVCFSFFFFLFARQTPGHVAFVVTRSVIPPPPEIITALSF